MVLSSNVHCGISVATTFLGKPRQETMVYELIPKQQTKRFQT